MKFPPPTKRQWIVVAIFAAVIVASLMFALKDDTLAGCLDDASRRPTGQGVNLAMSECYKSHPHR